MSFFQILEKNGWYFFTTLLSGWPATLTVAAGALAVPEVQEVLEELVVEEVVEPEVLVIPLQIKQHQNCFMLPVEVEVVQVLRQVYVV